MASKRAHQSLNDQQNEEVKTLIDRKTEIQKQINQAKLILKDHQDANLKLKKSHRQKNPQIAQLEKKLSKLKADLKEIEHAISERGSTTNSVEVEHASQDNTNDIEISQESCYSASEETAQSESEIFVPKDENNVTKPACRKCERLVTLDEAFKRAVEQNAIYAEREKINERIWKETAKVNKDLEEINIKHLTFINEKTTETGDLRTMLLNQDKVIEDLEEQLKEKIRLIENQNKICKGLNEQLDAKQRLIEKLQQNDISSKELSNKLETLENDLLERQKLEEK